MDDTLAFAVPSRRVTDADGRPWRVRFFTPSAPTTLLSAAHARGWLTLQTLPEEALVHALAAARPVAKAEAMRRLVSDQGWGELGGA
jgi:hypothetical protein